MSESREIADAKIVLQYRYPEECCGRCTHAFQNDYGDYQCNMLPSGNSIDLGALCNKYQGEENG